ncbi:MAG: hydroxymethylbilane synthase [Sphingobium sp. 32-64-5]|nr:MAG: hydroxymethylbilane synthase [Sphingobium sp. 32-64-5]
MRRRGAIHGHSPQHRQSTRTLPLKVGTRGSPLALWQTRHFLGLITKVCPLLRQVNAFEECVIATSGDKVQDRRLADIGGKGLFAKEIHEALLDGRVDFAVHSMKDLETELPPGIVLACALQREDSRDAIVLGPTCPGAPAEDPYACLPQGALIGTASIRRQSQLLHARPDLRVEIIRGNVQMRLAKVRAEGGPQASLLAIAGLKRMEMAHEAAVVLDAEVMVPAACQGIVGVTVRADDVELRELLSAIEDRDAACVSAAERGLLGALGGAGRPPLFVPGLAIENGSHQLGRIPPQDDHA